LGEEGPKKLPKMRTRHLGKMPKKKGCVRIAEGGLRLRATKPYGNAGTKGGGGKVDPKQFEKHET